MSDKLTFLICSHFLAEAQAVMAETIFKDAQVIAYQADCDQPIKELRAMDGKILKKVSKKVGEVEANNILIGGYCLKKFQKSNSKLSISRLSSNPLSSKKKATPLNLYRLNADHLNTTQLNMTHLNTEHLNTVYLKELCFELLLAPDVLQAYIDQGAHLFTPAMLDSWQQVNHSWKFKQASVRNLFFSESTSKLVLIDAGINPSARSKFKQIAKQLQLPYEVKKITLDRLRWQLLQYLSNWRLSLLSEKDKRLSDYAMINELISNLVTFLDEEKVIDESLQMFHMFCATQNICFLSIDEKNKETLYPAESPFDQEPLIQQLKTQTTNYQLQADGFQVKIKRDQQLLAILCVKEVDFPQYINHYLNLARNIAPIIALSISNARIHKKQLESQQKIHHLNSELNSQLDSVNNLNQELESFTYSVSHDLRGPLRSLDGFSNILVRDYTKILDSRGQGFLNRIRANAQRMGELIDDLLRLSRLTRTELIIQEVNLSDIALELSQDLQQSEPERQVNFIIDKGLIASGDASLLRAVLENLIGNSWKYTSKCKQAEIKISQTINKEQSFFYIKDNGAGFNMDYADKLFAPFQRLHSANDYPGTGIGLATVQRIIQRHRGKIWADSKPNHGACFYFSLGQISTN